MKLSTYQMLEALDAGDWTTAVRLVSDEFSLSLTSVVAEIRRPLRIASWREVCIVMPGPYIYEWTTEDGFLQVPIQNPDFDLPRCVIWCPNALPCKILINL